MTTNPLSDITTALGLTELEPAEQEEVLLTLNDLIFRSSLVRVIEKMDDATRESFSVLLAKDAPEEEIEAFLKQNVPSADTAVQEAIAELTDDILAVTK